MIQGKNDKKNINFKLLVFIIILSLLGYLSYRRALVLNYIADDWIFVYFAKYNMPFYIRKLFNGLHPGELFIGIPFVYFFGSNVFLWNIWGFILKIIASLSVGLALYGLTGQKRVFYYSSLLYVTYYAGLDAFITMSWRTGVYTLVLMMISTFSYIKFKRLKSNKYFMFFLLSYTISLAFDPMRIFPFPFILLAWDLGDNYVDGGFRKIINNKSILLAVVSIFGFLVSNYWFSQTISTPSERLTYILGNSQNWKSFFKTLNLLITSYRINISNDVVTIVIFGSFLLGALLTLFKKKSGPVIIYAFLFIPIFFFPNWAFNIGDYIITFRYLLLTGVGFVMILTLFISFLPKFMSYLLLFSIIALNIYLSDFKLMWFEKSRGYSYSQNYYDQQSREVPGSLIRGMFVVGGETGVRSQVFDSATEGILPYAISRNISEVVDVPYSVRDVESAKLSVCPSPEIQIPAHLNVKKLQEFPIPISKVYGWYVEDDGYLTNNTDELRVMIAEQTRCFKNVVHKSIFGGLVLESTLSLKDLYYPNDTYIGLEWVVDKTKISKIEFNIDLYDSNYKYVSGKKTTFEKSVDRENYFTSFLTDFNDEGAYINYSAKIYTYNSPYIRLIKGSEYIRI